MSDVIGAVGGVAAGGAAIGYGIKLAHSVIGPAFSNLGEVYRDWQDYRLRNWLKIGEMAEKLGATTEGTVGTRVAKKILDDSTMLSDPVMQAYTAGILVGARSEDGEDDEALPMIALVNSLTRRETTLHYLLYRALYEAVQDGSVVASEWTKVEVALPLIPVLDALRPDADTPPVRHSGFAFRALSGLSRQSLIAELYRHGVLHPGTATAGPMNEMRVVAHLTHPGLQLFGWAHGLGYVRWSELLTTSLPDLGVPRVPALYVGDQRA